MNRIYAVAPYFPDSEGKMVPELPNTGPCQSWNDCSCNINQDHYRERKTGPEFPILVVRCTQHKVGFTIYPFGFSPYGRSSIAPVAPEGSLSIDGNGSDRFAGTYFDAALDASKSFPWRHSYQEEQSSTASFVTQTRHLKRICAWLGIDPESDQQQREATIRLLDVPGQLLHDSTRIIKEHFGYQNRGVAICHIFDIITARSSLFERLAALGAKIGLWPSLEIWDSSNHCFRPSLFQAAEFKLSPD